MLRNRCTYYPPSIIRQFVGCFNVDFVKFLNQWNENPPTYKTALTWPIAKITSNAYPEVLLTHNTYVWNYFRTSSILKKQAYWINSNAHLLSKLINLNTKRGLKLKAFKLFGYVLNYIYNYFNFFDHELNSIAESYTTFFGVSRNFPQEFYSPDFLIRYIYLYLELIFLIKRVKPKYKKKKKKINPKMLVSYLPQSSRTRITIRLINSYINSSTERNNVMRLGDALLYLVLRGKDSFLYKKKITMYEKILEKKKFY